MALKGKSGKGSTKRKGGGGISLDDDDAVETGLFGSGPAVIKESIFAMYDYGGNAKPTAVWLLTYGRDGEDDYEQPYSLGKGWKVSDDGKKLIAKAGQTGLPKSCNAIRHLVKPLKAALKAADIEIDLVSGDPSVLDGLEVVLARVEQERRDYGKGAKKGGDDKERSILEIEEVTGTDGDTSAAKPAKKKAGKKRDEDEDDSNEDEDDSEAEEEDDDDEEDEKPAKSKKKASAAKGKKKSDDDDEDDESEEDDSEDEDQDSDDDDDYDAKEDGIEALVDLASEGDDVKYSALDKALAKSLKGNKHLKEIVAWATNKKNLKLEKGWSWDGSVVGSAD